MCLAQQNGVKKQKSSTAGDLFDDDYIEMDPVYTNPPVEEDAGVDDQGNTLEAKIGEPTELSL